MGIPCYFREILKRHKGIKKYVVEYDLLCVDSNSIIYDCYHMLKENSPLLNEDELIELIVIRIKSYSRPVYIAFDGVAPKAKMHQQRDRRYKSWHLSEVMGMESWTRQITPGSEFMEKLNKKLTEISESGITISSSNESGEGEHKIFKYIKGMKKRIVIEGEDADLIMLTILHSNENTLYVKRVDEYVSIYIDITSLKSKLCMKVDDYIVKSFFLGNDFLPNHPMFNLREHGMEILLMDSRAVTKNKKIDWSSLYNWLSVVGKNERLYLKMKNKESRKVLEMSLVPQMYRQTESYINPDMDGWERRYNSEKKSDSLNYIKGISWLYDYYQGHEVDQSWYYEGSSPLISEMLSSIKEYTPAPPVTTVPYTKEYQLSYVLDTSRLTYDWSYKKYLWESHMV